MVSAHGVDVEEILLGGEVDVSNNVNGVWLKGRGIISIVGWVEHLPDLSSPSLGETSLLEGDPVWLLGWWNPSGVTWSRASLIFTSVLVGGDTDVGGWQLLDINGQSSGHNETQDGDLIHHCLILIIIIKYKINII